MSHPIVAELRACAAQEVSFILTRLVRRILRRSL